ncbi:MAG: CAP domain-containing protein [Solirubrobacterales bacterium]
MVRKLTLSLLLAAVAAASLATASAGAAGLVAPASACAPAKLDAAAATQEQAMLCLTNFARSQFGEGQLEETSELQQSADEKAQDILRCDSFSHSACGREFSYWIRASGYMSAQCWRVGENLAWGTGGYGTVSSIFRAWLRSPEHRANLLGNYSQVGISLDTGDLDGHAGTHVWTQHFGLHC